MSAPERTSALRNRLLAKLRLRHLLALVRLAELGHVGRAAEALRLTQPAVTLLLADLERLIDAPLFLRHSRGVTPTDLALDLLPLARQMLARLDDGASVVASHRTQDRMFVRVAATPAGANGLLADALPDFCRRHPQIQLSVTSVDRDELSATLEREAIDVLFCREPALIPVGWRFLACRADRLVVVCGPGHALIGQGPLTREQLAAATWLPNTAGSVADARLEALGAAQGWTPREHPLTTRLTDLTWTALADGDLLTLVPQGVVQPWLRRGLLQVLPLDIAMPLPPLGVLQPEARTRSAAGLLADHVAATCSACA